MPTAAPDAAAMSGAAPAGDAPPGDDAAEEDAVGAAPPIRIPQVSQKSVLVLS